MDDCAKCDRSVNVPDGYEFNEGDMCWPCLEQELKDVETLNRRLAQLLDETANALHGGPMENGMWSFHDLPELATKANKRIADLENCIRELLKGGEHEDDCDNDPSGYGGPCWKHLEESTRREEAARKILGDKKDKNALLQK
jgi:hypothetical protein